MAARWEDMRDQIVDDMTAALLDEMRHTSSILDLLTFPDDPWARRAHLRRSRWRPWRKVLVWDETAAEHAERIAKLGPAPVGMVYHYPRMKDRAPGPRP